MPRNVPALPGIEASSLPFSQVVEANGFVFLAGQVGDAPGEAGAVRGGIAPRPARCSTTSAACSRPSASATRTS